MAEAKTLQQTLIEELGKRAIESTELPEWLTSNLNPGFPLRPYQTRAFQYYLNYWAEEFEGKPRHNHQLLFHMATGSGKTMMMAGLILQLYAEGYRRFLFFVNSTNVIEKTRDNFLNGTSRKYLFAPNLYLANRPVAIRPVDNFQASSPDDINIVFTTIQGLHTSLNTPREDELTYDDFETNPIALISDEAHHINVETKKGKNNHTQAEFIEAVSWEGTVERVFRANPRNVLLEFTATVDLTDANLASKYNPRLIFDYPLREFRKDGYSKEVKVLQADLLQFDRALQAVLLSQYRRKLFERNRIRMKPVILFKSRTIKESQVFFESFVQGMATLTGEELANVRKRTTDPTLATMFEYFDQNGISMDNLAIELTEDFTEDRLISVNSKDESEAKQIAVNSLEDEANEYRAVFAVDKLNEGWDVLNLFDIVRLYDTRDSKAGKVGKTTMSEAQLIGRGARYCPFQISDDQPLYGRKFDADLENPLRVCEELYYHSAYNPKYVQELNTALQEIGIKPKESRDRKVTLKAGFKRTELYKRGYVFLNDRVRYNGQEINGLGATIREQRHKVDLPTGYTSSLIAFEPDSDRGFTNTKAKDYDLVDFGQPVVRKGIQRLNFFEFANLRLYLPNLTSITEFIMSPKYLGQMQVEVTGLLGQVENLSPDQKLAATTQVLNVVSEWIRSEKVDYKGSKEFKSRTIKETFTDKSLTFAADEGGDREFGRSMTDPTDTAYYLDLGSRSWYVFSDCFGTSEEKMLVHFIDKKYAALKTKYSDVYLIRNEKHFKLFNFADGKALEPDFLLYLIGKERKDTLYLQVFIEPKGSHLLKADQWKERFLTSLKESFTIQQLFANKEYAVWGLPFFNEEHGLKEFEDDFNSLEA